MWGKTVKNKVGDTFLYCICFLKQQTYDMLQSSLTHFGLIYKLLVLNWYEQEVNVSKPGNELVVF